MEEIRRRLQALRSHSIVGNIAQLNIDQDYRILEESDVYGFSHINVNSDNSNDAHPDNLIESFRNDVNWFNPEAITLMLQAYEVSDSHMSLDMGTNVEQALHYLEIKKKQQKMFSNRFLVEGISALERRMIAESIQKFNESLKYDDANIRALEARAQAYLNLNDKRNARNDVIKALQLDPFLTSQYDRVQEFIAEEELSQRTILGKRDRQPALDTHNTLIKRLENSIREDSSSSESDHSSRKSSRKSKSKKHKRKHKHKHHRKHKDKEKDRKHSKDCV